MTTTYPGASSYRKMSIYQASLYEIVVCQMYNWTKTLNCPHNSPHSRARFENIFTLDMGKKKPPSLKKKKKKKNVLLNLPGRYVVRFRLGLKV